MKTTNVDLSGFLYHILRTLGTESDGRQKSSNVYDNNGGVVLLDDHDLFNLWQSAVRLVNLGLNGNMNVLCAGSSNDRLSKCLNRGVSSWTSGGEEADWNWSTWVIFRARCGVTK